MLLGRRTAPFGSKSATVRALGGLRGASTRAIGRETRTHELRELSKGELTIAKLRTLFGGGDRDRSPNQTTAKAHQQPLPLLVRQHLRIDDAPGQFDPTV